MDSLTQFVLGAAIGEACLGRRVGAKAAGVGGVCATLPDLDSFISYGEAVATVTYHRSFSHSLFVLCLLAPLISWLVIKLLRPPLELRRSWFLLVFLALLTHPLLDAFTVYGTQLLWPFYKYPFSGSTLFIIDPFYTLPLVAGLIAALFMARQNRRRLYANWLGLGFSCIYLLWSVMAKFYVEGRIDKELARQEIGYTRLLSTPAPFNTILWRFVIMTEGGYYVAYYSVLDQPHRVDFEFYADNKDLLEGLQQHWPVQRLQWFTHGFYAVREENGNIIMTDLRMGLESAYAFNFKVGELREEGVVPVPSEIRPGDWDVRQLSRILQRTLDPKP